jgi:NitT/TauT family transport system substrate-binding protein
VDIAVRRVRFAGLARLAFVVASLVLAACSEPVASGLTSGAADSDPITLRLGYFPNLTHAPALVGVKDGFFTDALGPNVTLETHTFNAGPEAVTALLSNSIDVAFMGPNPTTNAFVLSHGQAIRVISGSTSGGALLVVKPGINLIASLKGKKIADPQLGGTQDIALRWFLQSNGLKSDPFGGGDVSVLPQDNAQTLISFRRGQIDGAWVPEPWASRLIVEGGGHILVDERDLWPGGQFATTDLAVSSSFLRAHPQRVKALLEGLYESIVFLNTQARDAQAAINDAVNEITGSRLATGVVSGAWRHMLFTLDPLAASLATSAEHAHRLGLLASVDLKGLYDLTLLNSVLLEHGQHSVSGL